MSNTLALGSPCPACAQPMHPKVLECSCGVRVEGSISTNEFTLLSPEQLHLLRIFLKCEGRIRDKQGSARQRKRGQKHEPRHQGSSLAEQQDAPSSDPV